MEGAFGDIDISRFRAFPDKAAVRKVADHLLRENKITGPIHAAFVSKKASPLVGVDDNNLYHTHVQAYKDSAPQVVGLKKQLAVREAELGQNKTKIFNKDLLNFDSKVAGYRKGTLALGEYVNMLVAGNPAPASVKTFLSALSIEQSLDFAQVEAERARVIQALIKELSKSQTEHLMNTSLAYRLGKMRHTDFYVYVKNLCEQNKFFLQK